MHLPEVDVVTKQGKERTNERMRNERIGVDGWVGRSGQPRWGECGWDDSLPTERRKGKKRKKRNKLISKKIKMRENEIDCSEQWNDCEEKRANVLQRQGIANVNVISQKNKEMKK